MIKKNKNFVYFLGSGSASNYQYPRRKNTSIILELHGGNAIVDVGDSFPDNWNLLKRKYSNLKFPSALLFTHAHIDHIYSLAIYKYYASREKVNFQTFLTKETLREVEKSFHWLNNKEFKKIHFLEYGKEFDCLGEYIIPFKLQHGEISSTGFRLKKLAYIPDFDGAISKESLKHIEGAKIIIMECNDLENKSVNHNNLENAIELGKLFSSKWKIEKLILTHLGDDFSVEEKESKKLLFKKYPDELFDIIASHDFMKIGL